MTLTITLYAEPKELIELAEYAEKTLIENKVAEKLAELSQVIAEKVGKNFAEKLEAYADTSDSAGSDIKISKQGQAAQAL